MKKNLLDLVKGWVQKAESDHSAAKTILQNNGPYDTVCFHSQQQTEKMLKAFLAFHQCDVPRTHDIEELCLLCTKLDASISFAGLSPELLTSYAVDLRYDTDFWPDKETAEKALEQAEKICAIINQKLPS